MLVPKGNWCNNPFDDALHIQTYEHQSICKKMQDLPHPSGKKGETNETTKVEAAL